MNRFSLALALILVPLAAQAGEGAFAPGTPTPTDLAHRRDVRPAAAAPAKETPSGAVLLPEPSRMRAPASAIDSTIAAMVAAVDESELFAFLEKLSGEAPVSFPWGSEPILSRYSGSRGQDLAATFLRSVLEGYGYDVEFHYFLFSSNLQSIRIQGDGSGLLVGADARILRTNDGTAWNRTVAGIETEDRTFRELAQASTLDWIVVGAGGVIATSGDGGQSWSPRISGTAERLDGVDVLPDGTGWACGANGTLLATTDSGATWTAQTSGSTSLLFDVDALDTNTAVVFGAGGTVLRTTDGGSTWTGVTSGTSATLYRGDFVGNTGWASGAGGAILGTTDGGASWTPQASGSAANLFGVAFTDASNGWVVGSGGTILHTGDGGATWTAQTSAGFNLLGVDAVSPVEAWAVGFNGTVLRTTDGGAVWETRSDTIHDGWVNVIGTLPGTTEPASEVLLGGHYDSFSDLPDPGDLAPGADDNGTGVAAAIEAARQLSTARFHKTIRIVLFSGEEEGLTGSAAYAQRAVAAGEQIHAMINLDSVGWNDDYFRIFSDGLSTWLGDVAYQNAITYAPTLTTYHWFCDTCNWSDHWSFQQQGFDAIVGIETWVPAPPQHHTTGDTLGLVDIPLVANVTRIVLSTVATIAGVDTTTSTGIDSLPASADGGLRLHAGAPNPMSRATRIAFDLPRVAAVRLAIYGIDGRLVKVLEKGRREAGRHELTWDGTDRAGRAVAAGTYFSRLESGGQVRTRAITVLR